MEEKDYRYHSFLCCEEMIDVFPEYDYFVSSLLGRLMHDEQLMCKL